MTSTTSARKVDSPYNGFDPDGVFWDQAVSSPASEERVVPLFTSSSSHATDGVASEDEWVAAITLVRTAAAQVRAIQQHSQDSVEKAEAFAAAAQARAEKAEECVRKLLARVRLIEERAQAAEARAAEATTQLRRLHDCVIGEFAGLTESFVKK